MNEVTVTVIGLVIAMIGPICIAMASDRSVLPSHRLSSLLLAQAGLVVIVAAVLSVVVFFEQNSTSSIGLRPINVGSLAKGLALAAFFMFVFSPAAYRMLRHLRLGGFDKGLSQLQRLPIWYLVLAVIVGGVAEEILYRGYAIEHLITLTGSLWLTGAIPVVIFAFAHVPMWGWGPALTTLVSGAVFTLVYLWQRDLTACIIAHVVTDFAGIVYGPLVANKRVT